MVVLDIDSTVRYCRKPTTVRISCCCVVGAGTRLARRDNATSVIPWLAQIVAQIFRRGRKIICLSDRLSSCDCCSANAMAIQKKHGKGRLDKWYKLAKEKGMRLAQTCVDNTDSQRRLQSAGGV